MIKKYVRFLLSYMLICSLSFMCVNAYQLSFDDRYQAIMDTYGIPEYTLHTLDESMIQSLFQSTQSATSVTVDEFYFEIANNTDGNLKIERISESEFLNAQLIINDRSAYPLENSWMKVRVTILELANLEAEISCAFTWKNPQVFDKAYFDILNMYIGNGTIIPESANGFYQHYDQINGQYVTKDFSSANIFSNSQGIAFQIPKMYIAVQDRYSFIRTQIKRGQSTANEGINVDYQYQDTASVAPPTFGLNNNGSIKYNSSSIGKYTEISFYTSHRWET